MHQDSGWDDGVDHCGIMMVAGAELQRARWWFSVALNWWTISDARAMRVWCQGMGLRWWQFSVASQLAESGAGLRGQNGKFFFFLSREEWWGLSTQASRQGLAQGGRGQKQVDLLCAGRGHNQAVLLCVVVQQNLGQLAIVLLDVHLSTHTTPFPLSGPAQITTSNLGLLHMRQRVGWHASHLFKSSTSSLRSKENVGAADEQQRNQIYMYKRFTA